MRLCIKVQDQTVYVSAGAWRAWARACGAHSSSRECSCAASSCRAHSTSVTVFPVPAGSVGISLAQGQSLLSTEKTLL